MCDFEKLILKDNFKDMDVDMDIVTQTWIIDMDRYMYMNTGLDMENANGHFTTRTSQEHQIH